MSEGELKKRIEETLITSAEIDLNFSVGSDFGKLTHEQCKEFKKKIAIKNALIARTFDEAKQELTSRENRTFFYWLSDKERNEEGKFQIRKYICIDYEQFKKWFGDS